MQQHEQQRTGPSQGEGQRSRTQMSSGENAGQHRASALSVTELRERLAAATAALLDERERLMLRIAEIDAELRATPNAHLPRGGTAVASVLDYLRAVTAPQNRTAIYAAAGVAPGYGDQLLRRLVAKGLVRRVAHGAYEATRSSVPGCEVSR